LVFSHIMERLLTIFIFFTSIFHLHAQSDSLEITIDSIEPIQVGDVEFIDPIEIWPEFPGGKDSLRNFIDQNNKWQVGNETIVGKVYVAFVVEIDGSISNIEIMRGLHATCDKEAKRIISLMPNWKPGKQMGITVRTRMIIPITFDGMK